MANVTRGVVERDTKLHGVAMVFFRGIWTEPPELSHEPRSEWSKLD